MLHLFVLAAVLSACFADSVEDASNLQKSGSYRDVIRDPYRDASHDAYRNPYDGKRDHLDRHDRRDDDKRDDDRQYDDKRDDDRRGHTDKEGLQYWWSDKDVQYPDDDHEVGPVILRNIKSNPKDEHRRINKVRQNEIVEEVYSPDYAQPTWVIDYRFLKSGGRDYVRGPGGQIVILPKGVRSKEPKQFKDYDELIEHLRQKNIAGRNSKPSYFMPLGQEAKYDYKGYQNKDDGDDRRVEYDNDNKGWY